jgi:transcription antitermination protein NusB
MSRRIARELAFKILFQTDIGRNPWQEVLPRAIQESNLPEKSQDFLEQLVKGTIKNLKEIDNEIIKYAQDWKLERMANTDRNILRMAIFEIKFMEDIPPGVTVNEAVVLAKKYGDDESGKFVNGILGNVVRGFNPASSGPETPPVLTEE